MHWALSLLSRIAVWFRVSILFLMTVGTTTFFGSVFGGYDPSTGFYEFSGGFFFSGPLLVILVSHELGHYLMCRQHNLRATPPHFLPFVVFPGTLGAFIRIQDPIPDRRVLMEVGAGGPLAGMMAALPLVVAGLSTSLVLRVATLHEGSIFLGEPLLARFVTFVLFGSGGQGVEIIFNAVALAAWLGFMVTLLNLLPVGQLDGGHIIYSMFPTSQLQIARSVLIVMALLAVFWPGWLVWLLLIYRIIGLRHPPTSHDHVRLQPRHYAIGYLSIAVFVLILMPIPVSIPEWNSLIIDGVYLIARCFHLAQ